MLCPKLGCNGYSLLSTNNITPKQERVVTLLIIHVNQSVQTMSISEKLMHIKPQYSFFNSPSHAILFVGVESFRISLDDKNLGAFQPREKIRLVYALQILYIEKASAEFLKASKENVQVKIVLIQTRP